MSVRNSITGPFAEITVGTGRSVVVFNLPKQLLCESSAYFKAALNNGFAETATQKITLDDDDPEIFRTYAAWLFEHEITLETLEDIQAIPAAGPTAQIIVGLGENTRIFHVHKKLLCDSSTYFDAALNNGFAETKDQVVRLDDEEPDHFRTFVLWLYEGKLNKATMPSANTIEKFLLKLYVFADKRGIGNLANDTITMLAAFWTENHVTMSEIAWAVRLVSPKSKLYDLCLDMLVLEIRFDGIAFVGDRRLDALSLPKEFLLDLLLETHELVPGFNDRIQCFQAVCHYHHHEGKGIMSKKDCIRNIEAGCNIYQEVEDLEQGAWEGDML